MNFERDGIMHGPYCRKGCFKHDVLNEFNTKLCFIYLKYSNYYKIKFSKSWIKCVLPLLCTLICKSVGWNGIVVIESTKYQFNAEPLLLSSADNKVHVLLCCVNGSYRRFLSHCPVCVLTQWMNGKTRCFPDCTLYCTSTSQFQHYWQNSFIAIYP